ncbi:MAG TPA: hypothetical protein VM912_05550, partial [Terriglobales bacterium]|nr:hypothetical protein [Terriglobales bacterium]
ARALCIAVTVIHGTDKLWIAVTAATTSLVSALPARAAHALMASAAGLIVLSFAATMAASSPVAGVLWLVRSFVHRLPVGVL